MTAFAAGRGLPVGLPVAGLVPSEDAAIVGEIAQVAALLARLGKSCGRTASAGR